MRRLIGLLCLILLSAGAVAQAPPFRFVQSNERVTAVKDNASQITYELAWAVPQTDSAEYPEVVSHVGVTYQWKRSDGSLSPQGYLMLHSFTWKGRPQGNLKLSLSFSAARRLRHSFPKDAVACVFIVEIDSRLTTPGYHQRYSWRSERLTQGR